MSSLPDDERYEWAQQWQIWIIVKYDYGTGQWGFKQYMPRGWQPSQPNQPSQTNASVQQPSQTYTGYQQAEGGQEGGAEDDNEEDDGEDENDPHEQAYQEGQSNVYLQAKTQPGRDRVDSHSTNIYPYTGASPARAADIRSTLPSPASVNQPYSVSHTQSSSSQGYLQTQPPQSSYHQQALTPSHYIQKSFPRGKGPYIQGTYTGPSTPHYEKIDPSFYVRNKDFFFEGRVFAVIMNETAGSASRTPHAVDYNTSHSFNAVKYEDNIVYTNVRRFVVVRTKREFCFACPIFTYMGRATTKPGVKANEHGIVYSYGQKPQLLPHEGGITKPSLPVIMSDNNSILDKASRIYYGIHHPIQYNVKVKDIGYVLQQLIPTLIGNWREEDENDTQQESADTQAAEDSDESDDESDPTQQFSKLSISGKSKSGSKYSKSSGHKKKNQR